MNLPPAPFSGSRTVLVVDDEEIVCKTIDSILSKQGYVVLTARDGVEGLELFRQHRETIELVLLDLSMPRMSGSEVIAHLQQLGAKAKVLILSGYDAQSMGVTGVPSILKPIRARELIQQVEKALKA